ncbi:hypothetical protein BLA13014_07654 [Burkholderia aenigmatica]|uniref:Uncharacterized protein n=1 Tax=Burkholderia aenigmatica TaxID=2015348 RepID=A0A6P2SPF7_9BURK|nr:MULTISPECIES: hypothetical protein [Burkholderia]VWC50035.1 hypothetical protein BLA13014_07654 [Burkholderia aenigmatica]
MAVARAACGFKSDSSKRPRELNLRCTDSLCATRRPREADPPRNRCDDDAAPGSAGCVPTGLSGCDARSPHFISNGCPHGVRGVMRAVDRNRTARVVADRLDGLSLRRHDALRHGLKDLSRCPASVHRQAVAPQRRAPGNSRIALHADAPRHGFRMHTPSRGCDARGTRQPVFEHTSHPAPRRATRTTPIRVAERARAA